MSKTSQPETERREYPRLRANIRVDSPFQKAGEPARATTLSIRDIGGNGVSLESEKPISPSKLLELQLKMPTGFRPITIQGKVVWCKKMPLSPKYRVGIAFGGINEKDRREIIDYVRHNLPEWRNW